jgi:hypothetical protein
MLFGATRLADLGGSLGKGIREFRKNVKDGEDDEEEAAAPHTTSPSASVAQPAEGVVAAVKCPSCGALNAMGSRHCNQCGASIAATVS